MIIKRVSLNDEIKFSTIQITSNKTYNKPDQIEPHKISSYMNRKAFYMKVHQNNRESLYQSSLKSLPTNTQKKQKHKKLENNFSNNNYRAFPFRKSFIKLQHPIINRKRLKRDGYISINNSSDIFFTKSLIFHPLANRTVDCRSRIRLSNSKRLNTDYLSPIPRDNMLSPWPQVRDIDADYIVP